VRRLAPAGFTPTFSPKPISMTFKDKYPTLFLEIALLDMPTPVWRQLAVRAGTSMRELHHIIQAIMPWQTYHLYEFTLMRGGAKVQIGDTKLWDEDMAPENDDRLYYIEDVFRVNGDQVIYTYDLGDDWRHQVKLIDIHHDPFQYPVLPCILDAKGLCPPEDSGGPHGFTETMKAYNDIKHPEHERTVDMLFNMGWNPYKFKVKKLQDGLNKYKTVMWKQYM
jgi:hypothetical protein